MGIDIVIIVLLNEQYNLLWIQTNEHHERKHTTACAIVGPRLGYIIDAHSSGRIYNGRPAHAVKIVQQSKLCALITNVSSRVIGAVDDASCTCLTGVGIKEGIVTTLAVWCSSEEDAITADLVHCPVSDSVTTCHISTWTNDIYYVNFTFLHIYILYCMGIFAKEICLSLLCKQITDFILLSVNTMLK